MTDDRRNEVPKCDEKVHTLVLMTTTLERRPERAPSSPTPSSTQRLRGRIWLFTIRAIAFVGITRHAAVAAGRRTLSSTAVPRAIVSPMRKVMWLIAGSSLIGSGVALFSHARLGLPPYDVLVSGLNPLLGTSQGQSSWILASGLFLLASILGHRPTIWGIAYIFANGLAIDAVMRLVGDPETLVMQIAFAAGGTMAIASGVALVVHSGTTGGPFELLMAAGEDRRLDSTRVRTVLELVVLGAGLALGGSFGPATIGFALVIGPLLRVTRQALADHDEGRARRLADRDQRRVAIPSRTRPSPNPNSARKS